LIHDLADCACAAIYCDESKTGPAEIIAVVPSARRTSLREEFAFEFVAFARFLRCLSPNAELPVHEAITAALREHTESTAVAFALNSGLWPDDVEAVLSRCVEKIAVTLCRWLDWHSGLSPRTE
jgi:hypothetical protein